MTRGSCILTLFVTILFIIFKRFTNRLGGVIKKTITFLREPFPQNDNDRVLIKYSIFTGLIVTFILAAFRPFGFSEVSHRTAINYALVFGAITIAVALFHEFSLKYILKLNRDHPNWTFWKWLLSNLMIVVYITITNYFFTVYVYELPHSANHFAGILWSTISIGIFPVSLIGLLIMKRSSIRNEKIASEINFAQTAGAKNGKPTFVRLPIHQSEKFFEIDARQIICIEAMQNYVHIHYNKENEILKKTIRNTISSIEQTLLRTDIQRSHRSFLVNTTRIKDISGNAQGLKLEMNPSPGFWIPVSRKYIPVFKNLT